MGAWDSANATTYTQTNIYTYASDTIVLGGNLNFGLAQQLYGSAAGNSTIGVFACGNYFKSDIGTNGYAFSSLVYIHTRRIHRLLVQHY